MEVNMGFRHFPSESSKKQYSTMKKCCTNIKNYKEYDCGCSWGCNVCWVSYECKKCGNLISSGVYEHIEKGNVTYDKIKPKTKYCECVSPQLSFRGILKKNIRFRHRFCKKCSGVIRRNIVDKLITKIKKFAPKKMGDERNAVAYRYKLEQLVKTIK
jgi:hypothetical protein